MAQKRLSDVVIRNTTPPAAGQETVWDTTLPNFGLRISHGGTKSFVVMYRHHGRRMRLTIGKYPIISLGKAREIARRTLAQVELGDDPQNGTNSHTGAATTFSDAVTQFLDLHAAKNNRPQTKAEYERILNTYFKKWHKRGIKTITIDDVTKIIDELLDRPSMAIHAFAVVRKFFNWARDRRLIEVSPCDGLKNPARPQSRDRVLSDKEIKKVYDTAQTYGYPFGSIVTLLLLTAQRRTEISALQWSYIENNSITIPADLSKSTRMHTFPLTPTITDLFDTLPRTSDFVFPARGNPDASFSGFSKSKQLFDKSCGIAHWTLHDIRRSVATQLASFRTPPHIIERLLGHTTGTLTPIARIYNRFEYLDEIRAALIAWEERLHALKA